jgi:clan AA aspartic protease (TIGR02281 family)
MRHAWICVCAAAVFMIIPGIVRCDTPATNPADPLVDKGLTKVGNQYILKGDTDAVAAMKSLRLLHAKMEDDNKKRAALETQIKSADNALANGEFQYRQLNSQMGGAADPTIQNQIIGKMNALRLQMDEAEKFKETSETKLHEVGAEDRSKYIAQVLDLATKISDVQKSYADLSADSDVKTALDNAKPKAHLGPSGVFVTTANLLKKWRADISSDSVPLDMQGTVPMVEVTLNGKITKSMVVDSGASMVALPADLAKQLGLIPGPNDPIIRFQQADGKIMEATKMQLESVRVGPFTVEKVDCAVLPPTAAAAEPLLGGTFLNNYIYKVDTDGAKLYLAQINGGKTQKRLGDSPADMSKPGAGANSK